MDIELIRRVIATLDGVEVKGRDNLDRLLGCINALQSIVDSNNGEEVKTDGGQSSK